jgi:hypothetical protein
MRTPSELVEAVREARQHPTPMARESILSAELADRLPTRLRRWRLALPEEAEPRPEPGLESLDGDTASCYSTRAASVSLGCFYSSEGCGMTVTGRFAWCTKWWLTLPARNSAKEPSPRRPVTMRSTCSRSAISSNTETGRPSSNTSR